MTHLQSYFKFDLRSPKFVRIGEIRYLSSVVNGDEFRDMNVT